MIYFSTLRSMQISITKKFTFEAAHQLPNHDGKCKNLHGHSYVLEVTVSGPIIQEGPKEGMIMDFKDLSEIVDREIINQWDHQYLNDILPFVTTAENLATEALSRLQKSGLPVTSITLWETAKSFVTVTP